MATNGTMDGNENEQNRWSTTSTIPMWLDGKEKTTSATFDVVSPVTGEVLYKCSSASKSDADAAISSCQKAFGLWSKTKPACRRDIFLRAAEIFERRRAECWKSMQEETGSEPEYFGFVYAMAIESCRDIAGLVQTINGRAPPVADQGRSAIIYNEPYGVVLGIAPWNAPYALGVRACLQPLACGNTVILKGPEVSPLTFWAIASVFHEAGLPAGCLNTIYHRPGDDAITITNALISSPLVKKISFTGSTHVGSLVAKLAGQYLKPVLLELGGKASCIVCQDADVEKAAFASVLGAFSHGGQICMSTERILVRREIAREFEAALKTAFEKISGDRTKPSVLIGSPAVDKNKRLVKDAVSKGAKVLCGNIDAVEESKTRLRPLIVGDIKKEMDIYYTESFGPSVSLIEVESDEDAIRIANDTEYGLTCAVFTNDLRRGFNIAKQIETGAVHINGMTVHDETALPHGGAKNSGFGRFNGKEGLNEWIRYKTVTWED